MAFSVLTGDVAFFNNASIQNIISRVTGGNLSTINGVIGAKGTANLYLISPNGLVFDVNAQLNIASSFIGMTAESIHFNEGNEFSASRDQA